jgi:hypothetical protein
MQQINNAMKISSQVISQIQSGNFDEDFTLVSQSVNELTEVGPTRVLKTSDPPSVQIVALSPHSRGKYERLSLGIESVTEVKMLFTFLMEGKLPPLASLAPCDDEEFIGATLNFTQQLVRYCSNCALAVCASTTLPFR